MAGAKKGSGAKASPRASAKKSQSPESPPAPAPADASVEPRREGHSEFELSNEEIEQALRTGDHSGLLEDYFGHQEYLQLRQLSREAATRSLRGGPRVLILPGIMGSKLGRRQRGIWDDVLWFDPVDIGLGRMSSLALRGSDPGGIEALGVMLTAYLKLKLRLRAAGFDAEFHPYDWRLSLADIGKALVERLGTMGGGDVSIVAHSMGGLVARWALGNGGDCRRLIMLGTPNYGSFAPVQALRATYPVVRKVAALDQKHTAEALARNVFSTFPGLTQLLPSPEKFGAFDLYDTDTWPRPPKGPDDGLRPRAEVLSGVAKVHAQLAEGDKRFTMIAGVDQRTVVGLRRDDQEGFLYEISLAGDGTVPLELARLPDVTTYYVAEGHGSLANHRSVGRAVVDLLVRDATDALPKTYRAEERRSAVQVEPESALRVDPYTGRRGSLLSRHELRTMIEEVAAPSAHDESTAGMVNGVPISTPAPQTQEGYQHAFDRIVVGRRRQHRVDLRFALGSITEADARALALGIFRDVTPTGAATAIDRRLGGALTELSTRRMYAGNVGEVFMLPTGRHPVAADLVALVGLGPFDRFNEDVLQVAAENIIRTFVNTRVEEFATVLFGAGSGERPAAALRGLLAGFIRGLSDADRDHHFRRIIICEQDPQRYTDLKEELYRLSSTSLCEDLEFTFDEVTLPPPLEVAATRGAQAVTRPDPVYLIVRQERTREDGVFDVRSSVLSAGSKATVVTGMRTVSGEEFDALVRDVASPYTKIEDMERGGGELARLILAEEVRAVLPRQRDRHLVLVHDAPMSRVPWETIALDGTDGDAPWLPAAEKGLTHRYAADNLSVAKWLEERLHDEILNVLLVVNPTADLDGAEAEGERVQTMFGKVPNCRLTRLYRDEATRPALLSAFASGEYDVVHYAGHAFFQEDTREASGLLCHGHVPLTGVDLAGLGNLPTLVFFNACESVRVRGGARKGSGTRTVARSTKSAKASKSTKTSGKGKGPGSIAESPTGFAEAFLRGGVANFLGTYWEVGDEPAALFADAFYTRVIGGATLGDAIQEGRAAVRETRSRDWADYVFYGNPDFILKVGASQRGAHE